METAPKDGTRIRLRYRDGLGYYAGHGECSWNEGCWINNTNCGPVKIAVTPVHWMLLPTPPKLEKRA